MAWPSTGLGWFTLFARIYAAAGAALLLAAVIGSALFGDDPWPPNFTLEEGVLFAFFPIGMIVGLSLGVWRPLWGGAIATLCLVAFYLGFLVFRSELPRGPYFILFSGAGPLLLLATWLRSARRARQS
jgi:hypothetical protein